MAQANGTPTTVSLVPLTWGSYFRKTLIRMRCAPAHALCMACGWKASLIVALQWALPDTHDSSTGLATCTYMSSCGHAIDYGRGAPMQDCGATQGFPVATQTTCVLSWLHACHGCLVAPGSTHHPLWRPSPHLHRCWFGAVKR